MEQIFMEDKNPNLVNRFNDKSGQKKQKVYLYNDKYQSKYMERKLKSSLQ